jgi:hypothetical protein
MDNEFAQACMHLIPGWELEGCKVPDTKMQSMVALARGPGTYRTRRAPLSLPRRWLWWWAQQQPDLTAKNEREGLETDIPGGRRRQGPEEERDCSVILILTFVFPGFPWS